MVPFFRGKYQRQAAEHVQPWSRQEKHTLLPSGLVHKHGSHVHPGGFVCGVGAPF